MTPSIGVVWCGIKPDVYNLVWYGISWNSVVWYLQAGPQGEAGHLWIGGGEWLLYRRRRETGKGKPRWKERGRHLAGLVLILLFLYYGLNLKKVQKMNEGSI